MERTSRTRLALAGIIIAATLFGTQYSQARHQEQQSNLSPVPASSEPRGTRGKPPSMPMLWLLGSTLLGMVGLKRFGLYRG